MDESLCVNTNTIRYICKINIDDATVEQVEAARVRCGAPKEARFSLISNDFSGFPLKRWGRACPCVVEFFWEVDDERG